MTIDDCVNLGFTCPRIFETTITGIPLLLISDAHVGLQAARKAVSRGIPWQRCQFHLQQNTGEYMPKQSMKREVALDIRTIFNAPNRQLAELQLRKTVEKYAHSASRLADWLESHIPDGLTVFSFPEDHWCRIRTVNSLERVCTEIQRRTRVAIIFLYDASCFRLVSAM
jgi:putative transposase